MNTPKAGIYNSTNSSTATLRPRNARLISYQDDDKSDSQSESTAIATPFSKSSSTFSSNSGNPLESPSRSRSVSKGKKVDSSNGHTRTTSEGAPSTSAGSEVWTPWSSISGIASSFLGSDIQPIAKAKSTGKFKQPVWMRQDKTYSTPPAASEWGPSAENVNTSQSTIEERQAKLQAKKREALLLASATETRSPASRYKRRDSDADVTDSTGINAEQDALVYLHKIVPEDTLAGVTIKYSCQPDAFRKINRFWPNDNIQTRKHVFLPVEACSIRGKKVDNPLQFPDLLDSGFEAINSYPKRDSLDQNGFTDSSFGKAVVDSPISSEPLSLTVSRADDIDFRHDSWVILPSFKHPTEILRAPRRALGYFPRARRKSNSTLTDTSTTSTPKTSFDMLRHPPTHAAQTSLSLNASPVRHLARLNSNTRQRSSSTTNKPNSKPNFLDALHGPGGVGDLRGMSTEISRPGPGEDPLNRKFAHWIPDLAPPEDFPRTSLRPLTSSRSTPRASTDSARSVRSNSNNSSLGDVSGAIEGWVRKFAGTSKERSSTRTKPKMGDLIELETNSDLGESFSTSEAASGTGTLVEAIEEAEEEVLTPTMTSTSNAFAAMNLSSSTNQTSKGQSTATEEALLNERFPVRGRVKNAYGHGVGKDKGD